MVSTGSYALRSKVKHGLSDSLTRSEGQFTPSKKRTRFFQNKRIFTDFLWIFLANKRIFAKGVRDFLE